MSFDCLPLHHLGAQVWGQPADKGQDSARTVHMRRLAPSPSRPRPPTSLGGRGRRLGCMALLCACLPLGGCVAIGATLAGVGFNHQVSGIQYRTFTEPLPRVSRATVTAFKRMAFKLETVQPTQSGELIKGTASDRKFEVELEAITESTTRRRALARNRLWMIVT